ncbi:MAG: hypothetical protein OJF47_000745 [Nitrospira sp.]|jgi:hypothetical protein|nr:MAG: hypothetical protein OJF47_000745 [Nitrospira sp.]
MHITLDEEQWQVSDDTSLMDILACISDKAHANHRIVTSLTIGGKAISDRDLTPAFLRQPGGNLGPIQAVSQSLRSIIVDAKEAINRFAIQLRTDGQSLLPPLRSGTGPVGSIDAWLGRLADYMEMLQAGQTQGVVGMSSSGLFPWIQELLDARSCADPVRVADLLEYELLPRLSDAVATA